MPDSLTYYNSGQQHCDAVCLVIHKWVYQEAEVKTNETNFFLSVVF